MGRHSWLTMLSGKCDVESSPASKQYFEGSDDSENSARAQHTHTRMIGYTAIPRRDFYNQTGLEMRILMLKVM